MNILIINCGSSSLKFQLINAVSEEFIAKGLCERIGIEGSQLVYENAGEAKTKTTSPMKDHKDALQLMLNALIHPETGAIKSLSEINAVGHRIVHGGERFTGSVIINEEMLAAVEECNDLAPLHNPANLLGVTACQELMPGIPMVGVFDTAFHKTMPEEAFLYGIPYEYYQKYKLRRYGFHGTSHDFVSKEAAKLLGKPYEECKIAVCHLGNGASVTAVCNGKSIDTSMGLTPLEGVVMGTRSGDIDPAIIEFIAEKEGKTLEEIITILNKKSGVLGLSNGLSSDFRDIEDGYFAGEENAVRALHAFVYSVAKYIGAYTVSMNGLDAVCFTAGVGENSPLVRQLICEKYLSFLGMEIDEEANNKRGKAMVITKNQKGPQMLVIPTNEELVIARETFALLK